MRSKWVRGLAVALCLVPPAFADGAGPSVRVTIEVGKLEGGAIAQPSVYELIVPLNGTAQLSSGLRVPVPQGSASPAGAGSAATDAAASIVAISYQTVGLQAKLGVSQQQADRYAVTGTLDASVLKSWRKGSPDIPIVGSVGGTVSVTVRPGERSRVLSASDPELGSIAVELRAAPID